MGELKIATFNCEWMISLSGDWVGLEQFDFEPSRSVEFGWDDLNATSYGPTDRVSASAASPSGFTT